MAIGLKKLCWFFGIWAASVASLAAVAGVIRFVLRH